MSAACERWMRWVAGAAAATALVGCGADDVAERTGSDEAAATARAPYLDDGSLSDDDLRRLCVPPSVMMHSKDSERHQRLLVWLAKNGYATMTYADYVEVLEGRRARPRKAIILSLDDATPTFVNQGFRTIVSRTHAAGHVLSVAVNPQVPTTTSTAGWDLVREWQSHGSSMEDHGTLHLSLGYARSPGELTSCADHARDDETLRTYEQNESHATSLEFLIGKSACRIGAGVGKAPAAMILPFGLPRYAAQDVNAPATETRSYPDVAAKVGAHGMKLIVGIPGGRVIERVTGGGALRLPAYPAFVGRVDVVYAVEHPEVEIARWYRYPSVTVKAPERNLIARCAALHPEYGE